MPNHTNEIQENLKEQEVLTDKRHDKGYKKIFKVKKNFLDFLKKYTDLPWTEELTDKDVELIDNILWSDKFRDKQELLEKLQKLSERYQKLSKQDQNAWLNWFEHVLGIGKTQKSERFWEYFEKGDDRMYSALTLIMENERIEGEAKGKVITVKQIRKKIEKSLPLEDIADILELETYEIENIYHLLIEHLEWTDLDVATAAVEQEMLVK